MGAPMTAEQLEELRAAIEYQTRLVFDKGIWKLKRISQSLTAYREASK